MNTRKGDWMCTFSDVRYWPADPRAEEVKIGDIAHALSMLCRYTGHCNKFYSVAEHSVLVSQVVPSEFALIGLLHDAPEAYINDINKPLKSSLPDYNKIERLNWWVIAERFNLPKIIPDVVHLADMSVMLAEAYVLMPPSARCWNLDAEPADVSIFALPPEDAKAAFVSRYFELVAS